MENKPTKLGRIFDTLIVANYEDNTWEVIVEYSESRSNEGSEWITRSIAVKSFGKTYAKALETAQGAITKKIADAGGDIFTLPAEEANERKTFDDSDIKTTKG